MKIQNQTWGKAFAAPVRSREGRELYATVLKFTFAVDPFGRVEPVVDGAAEPDLVDQYNGDDAATASIKKPSQLFDAKPGTDVILIGHAHARGNVSFVDVSLRVGPIAKTVRAHGLRVWQQTGLSGIAPGPARPIRAPIPLLYELAWGGMDLSDAEHPIGEPRNYVGRGVARDPKRLVDRPAAQLEFPDHPIRAGSNVPASFGAIHRHWQPRMAYAGTYDKVWEETKLPLLPDDFDPRFHVAVPHDQWSPAPLRGDEPIEVRGAIPEGTWSFQLPRITPGFSSSTLGRREHHRAQLETILIDADARRVELTWRAAVPLPRKWEMLDYVRIVEKAVVQRS